MTSRDHASSVTIFEMIGIAMLSSDQSPFAAVLARIFVRPCCSIRHLSLKTRCIP